MTSSSFVDDNGVRWASERDASVSFEAQRWGAHGPYQYCIWLRGDRRLYVIGTRINVTADGSLLFYMKYKDEPEHLAGSFAAGEWVRFWIISALDGYPSHIVDDSAWWDTGKKDKSNRARERSKMSQRLRFGILERDNHTCKACGRTASDGVALHVDHIVAIANGGKTHEENLQTLCADCNQGKGAS